MEKNILILTGSPRKKGNSERLADAFADGAQAAGHSVVKFETAFRNIAGCKACNACFSTDKACVFDDAFNQLAPLMEKADVLVLSTPLYWYSFPAQIKAAIDKMYAFVVGERKVNIKESYLLVCGEIENTRAFSGIVESYRLIAKDRGWTDKGILIVPGVNEVGAVEKTNALKEARALGSAIGEA